VRYQFAQRCSFANVNRAAREVDGQRHCMGATDQPLSGESAAGGRDDHNSDNDSSHQFSFKSDRKSPTAGLDAAI
jgi:hypothetical protein